MPHKTRESIDKQMEASLTLTDRLYKRVYDTIVLKSSVVGDFSEDEFRELLNALYADCDKTFRDYFKADNVNIKLVLQRVFNEWDLFVNRLEAVPEFRDIAEIFCEASYETAFLRSPLAKEMSKKLRN